MFRHQHKLRETQLSLRPLNDAFSEEIPRGSISYETGHANDVGASILSIVGIGWELPPGWVTAGTPVKVCHTCSPPT